MKAAFVIALGWTLAVLVGAVVMPTEITFALGCGVLMTPLPMLAAANVTPAEREARRLQVEQSAALGDPLKYPVVTAQYNDAALLLSARWAVLGWATVLTAAVPLMVLWRLGGAE